MVSAFGRILPLFGRSTVEKGFEVICLFTARNVKKELSADILRALLRLDTFLFLEVSRNSWIISSEILSNVAMFFLSAKRIKIRMSLSYAATLFSDNLLSEVS